MSPKIGLAKQALDDGLALRGRSDALQDRQMIEHLVGGDARINAEVLREIAELPAQLLRLLEDIDVAELDAAFGRGLERRDRSHQRRFASAIGTEQAIHSARNRQADIVKRTHAICIGMADRDQFEHEFPRVMWVRR